MKSGKSTGRMLFATFFGVLLFTMTAQAVPIVTPSVDHTGGGLYSYRYELTNPLTETENIFDFGLFFTGDITNVTSPTGWDVTFGTGFIDWFSTDIAYDLMVGKVLGGFSFFSSLGPGEVQFTSLGYDPGTNDLGTPFTGMTIGPKPSQIPEPTTMVLVGGGLLSLFAFKRKFFNNEGKENIL